MVSTDSEIWAHHCPLHLNGLVLNHIDEHFRENIMCYKTQWNWDRQGKLMLKLNVFESISNKYTFSGPFLKPEIDQVHVHLLTFPHSLW